MTDNHTNAVAGPSTDMPVDPDSVGAPNRIVPPPVTPITATLTAAAPPAHTPPVEIITPAMLGSIIATAVKTAIESYEQAKVGRVGSESPATAQSDVQHLFRSTLPTNPYQEQPILPTLPVTPALSANPIELPPRTQWPRKFAGTDAERDSARVWLVSVRAFLAKWHMQFTDNPQQYLDGEAISWYLHLADTARARSIELNDAYAFEQFLQAFDPHYYDERLTTSATFHNGDCNMSVYPTVTRYTQKFDDLVRKLGDVSRTTIIEVYLKGLTPELRAACQFNPHASRFWIDTGDYAGLVSFAKGKEVELRLSRQLLPSSVQNSGNPGPSTPLTAAAAATPAGNPDRKRPSRFLVDLKQKLQQAPGRPLPGMHEGLTNSTLAEYLEQNKCLKCGTTRVGSPLTCPSCPPPKRARK
jgi:hypothetical protein